MLDLIVQGVPHARLQQLGIERGGCVQVASAEIDALLGALCRRGGGGGENGGNEKTADTSSEKHVLLAHPEGLPGGSAANVIKGVAGLARAAGA